MSHWADTASDPYLKGFYKPVSEERDDRDLTVIGELPKHLQGAFLRNGPNQVFPPLGKYHPFDGDGMLHAVYLENGRARYRNRYVRTPGYLYEQELGKNAYGGFSELRFPSQDAMKKVGPFKNVANTNIVRHGGKLLALWEGGLPFEVTLDLDTVGLNTLEGKYDGPFTAHPHIDPRTGELVAIGYNAFPPFLTYLVLDREGKVSRKEIIDIPRPVMMHDFAITAEHTIFLDAPALFCVNDAMQGKGPIIQWKPEHGCRLGVMPRHGTNKDVRWFEIDPCYVYHFMNAYEEGGIIHVDCGRLERLNSFGMSDDTTDPPSALSRFSIDLNEGTVKLTVLDSRRIEFPRIHDGFVGVKHSIGYGATYSGNPRMANYDTTLRYDLVNGTSQSYFHGEGRFVGELVFAPDTQGKGAEDAGHLMGFLYDSQKDQSECVIFDAKRISDGPVARILLPCRVPSGIHASFIPA